MSSLISVIIANWNTRDLLLDCLASIQANAGEFEIVVVDNGSTDGSPDAVRKACPDARLFLQTENQGYARANMIGLHESAGKHVLFLNSDTIIPPDTLTRLSGFFDKEPRVAACGPRLLRPDGRTQPYAFGSDPGLRYLIARACVRLGLRRPLHNWETAEVQPVDWVSGACLFVRRTALEQVGGFDERIFMYFEDNDLCLRLRRAGWQIVYNPQISVTHIGGASAVDRSCRREQYYRGLRYFYSKHYSFPERLALRMLLPFYTRFFE